MIEDLSARPVGAVDSGRDYVPPRAAGELIRRGSLTTAAEDMPRHVEPSYIDWVNIKRVLTHEPQTVYEIVDALGAEQTADNRHYVSKLVAIRRSQGLIAATHTEQTTARRKRLLGYYLPGKEAPPEEHVPTLGDGLARLSGRLSGPPRRREWVNQLKALDAFLRAQGVSSELMDIARYLESFHA